MKKALFTGIIFLTLSLAARAEGGSPSNRYLEIGLGTGLAHTMIGDTDIGKEFKNFDQIGVDLAAKAGYGPFGQIPLYVVFSMGGIGHRIADKSDYIQYNSYMIGGGVIFYPIRLIQIAGDIGYSYSSNSTSIQGISLKSGKDGFAGDISAALDLGKNNHGCLLGLRYFGAITKGSFDEFQKQSNISVFIRYAYRYKHAPGGED